MIHDITPYVQKNCIFFRYYCTPILTGTCSMGKGLEATDAVHAPPPISPLERAIQIVLTTPTAVKVASCRYYSLDSPHPAQEEKGLWTTHPNPGETLKTQLIFHWRPWIQNGAIVNDSAIPDWYDDPTRTANSGYCVSALGPLICKCS